MTSFYDLNYIIELNEKRLEQCNNAHEKYLGRFTILLVLYSAFTIFLVPIIEGLYFSGESLHWIYHSSFYLFVALVGYSLIYTIKLLIPTDFRHLLEPKEYYEVHRSKYEHEIKDEREIDAFLKAAYIHELQVAVNTNRMNLVRKTRFYRRAFTLAVSAVIPYLICVGYQVCIKKDDVHKVEIINKFINFIKTQEDGER